MHFSYCNYRLEMGMAFILLGSRRTFALKCALLTQGRLKHCEKGKDKCIEMTEWLIKTSDKRKDMHV